MWILHDVGRFSSIQEVFSGLDHTNTVQWTAQLENAALNFNLFAFDDLGWSNDNRQTNSNKVQMSRRSIDWNGKRRHVQALFSMLSRSFENLMCDVGCGLSDFPYFMRYFLVLEHIIDLVIALLYKPISFTWRFHPCLLTIKYYVKRVLSRVSNQKYLWTLHRKSTQDPRLLSES